MTGRILLLVLMIWLVPQVRAQDHPAPSDTTSVVELVLTDGSRLVGSVMSESGGSISFRTVGGLVVTVDPGTVRSRRVLRGRVVGEEFRTEDPNISRLLFTATGRPVGKGSGYFADYYLFFPFVAYGVTDNLTLAGGVSLIPGSGGQLFYVAPKATLVNSKSGAVSVGFLAGTGTGDIGDSWGGIMYGVGTTGNETRAITLGLGFLFGGGDVSDTPIFLVGGDLRLSGSLRFITENYIVAADGVHAIVSGGLRFYGDRLAADLGLITSPEVLDEADFPFLPFVGFAYNFGR